MFCEPGAWCGTSPAGCLTMQRLQPPDEARPARPGWMRRTSAAVWQRATDFVLPPLCLACHKQLAGHDALCARCWRGIDFIRPPLCDRLGIPLPYDTGTATVSAAALADPPVYNRARAAARFDGIVRDLVHGLKYADRHDGRRLFGRWLSAAGEELLSDADLLVPVPLHPIRLFTRRFNQAAILTQELARLRGLSWHATALRRVKRTPQQVGLTRDQRDRNMAAAFRVADVARSDIEDRNIVLIDDVITTGATVNACARALRSAGAARIDVLALAIVTNDGLR
jgi:ComF family protein